MKNLFFLVAVSLFVSLLAPTHVLALDSCDAGFELVSGVCIPSDTGLPDPDPDNPVWAVLDSLVFWLLSIFGTIAVMAFVVSGLMYLTSGGNENQIDTAKTYMIWSIVGVIVALSGFIILYAIDTWLNGYGGF
jgi:hypothetical protein